MVVQRIGTAEINRADMIGGVAGKAEHILKHPETRRHFLRFTDSHRPDGPMSDPVALEEAMTRVGCGSATRDARPFRSFATQENADRLRKTILGGDKKDETTLPDEFDSLKIIRESRDASVLASLMVAEHAGRNPEGKPRKVVLASLARRQHELLNPPAPPTAADRAAALVDEEDGEPGDESPTPPVASPPAGPATKGKGKRARPWEAEPTA